MIPKENRPRTRRRSALETATHLERRLRSLLRRRDVAALARELERRGGSGWIVGGAARDLLLGLSVPDVDVAVDSDPFEIARALEARGVGTFVPLSEGSPRVARVAGRHELDLAAVEGGGIERDLARRDFTANAIAIALPPERSGAAWIDPFGGISDLDERRLRAISARNLEDDPLRAWRAARLFATRDLAPDRATTAACRRAALLLPSAAPERIRAELEKMLAAPRVGRALLWAADADLLGAALGLPMSRGRARSVAKGPFDAPRLVRRPPEERSRLRIALLASRCGMDPAAARAWLAARRFPHAVGRRVAALLELARRASIPALPLDRWTWVRDAKAEAREAVLLARLLSPGAAAAVDAHARASREARTPPRITGRDVIAWLGARPGPEVGRRLAEIEIEGLRGAISTRADARRWLRSRVSETEEASGRTGGGGAGL